MSLKTLSPAAAQRLIADGALLIDIRNPDEHAREHIPGARLIPLGQMSAQPPAVPPGATVVFHCRSGQRTQMNAAALAACVNCEAYLLEGGLDGWKRAGLPVAADRSQPLELNRQVQIAAGSLALAGAVLGATVSPWFHLLSGFVGAGLVFAGLSGFCGMARLLARMPWNRRALAGQR